MELLVVKLGLLLEAQTDKIAAVLILVVALLYGSLFLLVGIVLLIHLWLAWWLSCLITGTAVVVAGALLQMAMKAAAKEKELTAKLSPDDSVVPPRASRENDLPGRP